MKISFIVKKAAKRYDTESKGTIYVRLRDGRAVDMTAPTKLSVNPNLWDDNAEEIKSKVVCSDEVREEINGGIRSLKSYLEKEYRNAPKDDLPKSWLKDTLDKYYNPDKYKTPEQLAKDNKPTFEQLLEEFESKYKASEVRKKNFRVVKRAMLRYEIFVRTTRRGQKAFRLNIDEVTAETLRDMWDFFENEHKYYEQYPAIYEQIPEKRIPKARGKNTLIDCFGRIRTFFNWCYDTKKTKNRPFDEFKLEECTYGTPVYITLEERDKLYEKDLSEHPQVEIQRDIFVFQSLIGCRIGDLYRMTSANVINDAVEYIPRKTKEGNPITVRVPLNDKAKAILEKYKENSGDKLLPFISEQKYNDAIKKAFKLAEINRVVTILDPLTNEEVKKPLYEVVSSHMARRTFIGNIYKRVKDPNLVGALSGHKEGSKAFARYREIDDEMKRELVSLLD